MEKPMFINKSIINKSILNSDTEYYQWIEDVKSRYHRSQVKAAIKVNSEMLQFYWELGHDIVSMKAEQKWGDKVVSQISLDLRNSFPKARGFSVTNIKYATRWYLFYSQSNIIGQRVVDQFGMPKKFGKIPWGHSTDCFPFQVNETVTNCNRLKMRAAEGGIKDIFKRGTKCTLLHYFQPVTICSQLNYSNRDNMSRFQMRARL